MKPKTEHKSKPKTSKVNIDADAVRQLADLFKETDLSEIEYEAEGCRIRVARNNQVVSNYTPIQNMAPQPPAAAPIEEPSLESHPGTVKSPMVGTVYLSPKPGDPHFVKVGSDVSEGQTLLIIEAMKVMNPLKATKSGKVTHILVEDNHPVEFDEPLLIIE